MSLIEAAKANTARRGPLCTMASFLGRLNDTDAQEVRDALNDPDVPSAGLWRVMVDRGWQPPKQQTIQRHRRQECTCG